MAIANECACSDSNALSVAALRAFNLVILLIQKAGLMANYNFVCKTRVTRARNLCNL